MYGAFQAPGGHCNHEVNQGKNRSWVRYNKYDIGHDRMTNWMDGMQNNSTEWVD